MLFASSHLGFLLLNLNLLPVSPPPSFFYLFLSLSLSERLDDSGGGGGGVRPAAWHVDTEVNWIVIRAEVIN